MASTEPVRPPLRARLHRGWGWALALAALAFAIRVETVLRGAGLFGRIGYDGSVYYASSAALTHGLLPYADALLLHPPGVLLALLPFAAVGRVLGDPYGFALARLAWFGLGAVSTALVFALVRRYGLGPAIVAAAAYAVLVPAVVSEHTTSLEAIGSVCLLGALALLTLGGGVRTRPVAFVIGAGALVGFATGTKVWGVAVVLALVGWTLGTGGVRRAALVLAGAVGATVAVCLPFFLAAPGPMWRMVVLDQLGRRRVEGSVTHRVVDLVGFSELHGFASTRTLAAVAGTLGVVILVLALRLPLGRLAALLLTVATAVLLTVPPWSVAYTGLASPAIALLLGCAVARLGQLLGRRHRIATAAVLVGLVAYAVASLPGLTFGSPFPGRSLERTFAKAPGCVTTDDPIALIETGALQRNIARRCPLVIDLSGYSYDLRPTASRHLARPQNDQWQRFALAHLAGGDAAVVVRFRTAAGLSRSTKATIAQWPVLLEVAGYQVRHPTGAAVTGAR